MCECKIQMHLLEFHDLENRSDLFLELGKTKLLKSESINIDFSNLKFTTRSSSENLLVGRMSSMTPSPLCVVQHSLHHLCNTLCDDSRVQLSTALVTLA